MARLNRDPTYDLGRHIVTGEKGPLSGSETLKQYDAESDRNDPMDPYTAGVGDNFVIPRSSAEVQQANLTQAMGLDSGDSREQAEIVDLNKACNCEDEPTKGGLSYGPRFMGGD